LPRVPFPGRTGPITPQAHPPAPALGDATVCGFLSAHGDESALRTTTAWQRLKYVFIAANLVLLLQYDPKIFFTIVTGVLCIFYLATIAYKLLTVFLSVVWPREICVKPSELARLKDEMLPVYTILVPMYHEAEVAGDILDAVGRLDYPRNKIEVILLLEEDDSETRAAIERLAPPDFVRVLVVPDGRPRTKPRACNHGLAAAKGEYLVIYDAEDRPDPDQLRKAVEGFRRVGRDVICLQAKLNYYNVRQNWLTKWFTLEYTTWFDLFLPGLNRLGVPIPLGGTSNHFRVSALRNVGGWDPFNVAEDCDLGIRLHGEGYRTSVLDSTTWEEASSRLGNWTRQRSRWVKGYVQTHLVHTRERMRGARIALALALGAWFTYGLVKVGGHLAQWISTGSDNAKNAANHAAVLEMSVAAAALVLLGAWGFLKRARRMGVLGQASFLLTVGGLSFSLLLNPIFWAAGAAWLYLRWQIWYPTTYYDDAAAHLNHWSVASHWFWYISVTLLVANAIFILIALVACTRRRLWSLAGYALLVPFYWVLISIAAWRGFLQLFTRAHYWDKTVHGLACPPDAAADTGKQ